MSYRFVIIGCGRIAERHAQQIVKHGVLTAVADIIPEKARRFSLDGTVKTFTNAESLLIDNQGDVAVVCSPNGLHAQHSILAMEKGFHVLCEKPMAISVLDGQRMVDAASANNKKLYIVKQNRFNPPVQEVKRLLDENKLGQIVAFQLNCFWNRPSPYYADSWRGTLALDGGTLYTQFSHFIDLLYWFLGPINEVKGTRQNLLHKNLIEFEDQGQMVLQMKSGVTGTMHYTVNSYKKNMEGSLTLFGEKGTVRIGGQYLNTLDYFEVENTIAPSLTGSLPPNQYGNYEGSMSNHGRVYEELIKALNNQKHDLVDATEALGSIEMIEAIYKQVPLTS